MSVLALSNVGFKYNTSGRNILQNLNYEFEDQKVYSIVGKSGAGKTTLLSLLAGLTTPTSGKVLFKGKSTVDIDRYKYRSQNVGVVFQSFNLLPHLTALENIILSMDASGKKFGENKKDIALKMLLRVDLDESLGSKKILHLSGGEQQRVAIARTLSFNPDVILADEPTGNLDGATQNEIMDIFTDLAHKDGKCVIIVTHSKDIAAMSDEVFELTPLANISDPKKPKKRKR
jgi:putative ABC transport system ATP-binding protein